MSEPPETTPRGSVGPADRRPAAERDTLFDLVGIFAHDINNPLQTLLVLSELGIDESEPGTDARTRGEQCLIAAERLRVLTQSLAVLSRGRPQSITQLWQRVPSLLGRRFERYGITVETDLEHPANTTPLPGEAELVLLAACLSAVASAAETGARQHTLRIHGEGTPSGAVALTFTLLAYGPNGPPVPVPHTTEALARLHDMADGTVLTQITASDGVLTLELLPAG